MLQRFYSLSRRARLSNAAGRRLLVCDYPLQQFELNDSAWRLLSAVRPGVPLHDVVYPVTPALLDFLEDKAAQGALLAQYAVTPAAQPPTVEVIIPVYANPEGLLRCLNNIAHQDYSLERVRVSVVDDGSPVPAWEQLLDDLPEGLTVRWLRWEINQGPATARNDALRTPWPDGGGGDVCAFIDSDCIPAANWLGTLTAVLEDETLAAVGGRVTGYRDDSWLARYEAECSSLNLGATGGATGDPAHRHAYLPTCNLLVKRAALDAVDGFRAGLRLGEDVDLCWRLRAAGQRLFYYPGDAGGGGTVAHAYRERLVPFLGRKRAYARSEAWLRRTHPSHFPGGGLAGLRVVALLAALASLGSAAWGCAVLVLGAAAEAIVHGLRRPRFPVPVPLSKVLWALLRRAAAGLAQVCRGTLRAGLVLWLPGVVLVPALWPAFAALLLLGGWAEWQARRPALRPWEFAAGFFLDALGYSVGKLEGMLPARRRE